MSKIFVSAFDSQKYLFDGESSGEAFLKFLNVFIRSWLSFPIKTVDVTCYAEAEIAPACTERRHAVLTDPTSFKGHTTDVRVRHCVEQPANSRLPLKFVRSGTECQSAMGPACL